jgi:hypothetical protein
VQRGHQKIPRATEAIAREDAPGSVGAMGRRRQADDEQSSARIAEAGDRLAPIRLVAEGTALFPRDLGTKAAKARTPIAVDDRVVNLKQRRLTLG